VHLGREILTHYFSCSGGPSADAIKSAMGHVSLNFYFCIWYDMWVIYYILVRSWRETSMHYFSCSSGLGADSTKSTLGHVMSNMCFASGVICGSCSSFWCVRGTKCRHTIFHARVGLVQIP
jgi:hypothetical protein